MGKTKKYLHGVQSDAKRRKVAEDMPRRTIINSVHGTHVEGTIVEEDGGLRGFFGRMLLGAAERQAFVDGAHAVVDELDVCGVYDRQRAAKVLKTKERRDLCSKLGVCTVGFKREDEYAEAIEAKTSGACPICLDEFSTSPITVTRCGHLFHKSCLKKHAETHVLSYHLGTTDYAIPCPFKCGAINEVSAHIQRVRASNDRKRRR